MIPEITEEWRPVPIAAFAHLYEVSNIGRVRSLDKIGRAKAGGKCLYRGQMMNLRPNHRGYISVFLRDAPLVRNIPVHRLVAGAFIPNPQGLPEVNHMDTIKINNIVTNLEWISRLGNHAHAVKSGIKMACIRKLSDEDVAAIIVLSTTRTNSDVARRFGINQSTVSRIVSGLRRANHQITPTQ